MTGGSAVIRRSLLLAGGVVMAGLVFVSAERARPAPTPLGTALGVVPVDARLAQISDAIALSKRAPDTAELAYARRAGDAAPLDAVPFYIAAAAPGRDLAQRRALIALALQRDPRLRPALAARLADRAAVNDVAGVTRALIRLAVLTRGNAKLWPAVAQISGDPIARKVIKQQIADGAQWGDDYLSALNSAPVDQAVVFEMVQAIGKGTSVAARSSARQLNDRNAFLGSLVANKEYERAYLAWVQWLPAQSQSAVGYVFDSGFTGVSALPPFGWKLTDGVGGATTIDAASGLSLDYSGTDGAIVAQQLLLLSPGRYRLTTVANFASVSSDTGASALSWSLTCLPGNTPLGDLGVPLVGAAKRVTGAPFSVAAGCDAQMLQLKVNSAEFAKRLSGKIRSISVEAVK